MARTRTKKKRYTTNEVVNIIIARGYEQSGLDYLRSIGVTEAKIRSALRKLGPRSVAKTFAWLKAKGGPTEANLATLRKLLVPEKRIASAVKRWYAGPPIPKAKPTASEEEKVVVAPKFTGPKIVPPTPPAARTNAQGPLTYTAPIAKITPLTPPTLTQTDIFPPIASVPPLRQPSPQVLQTQRDTQVAKSDPTPPPVGQMIPTPFGPRLPITSVSQLGAVK
jgi:hypothetical protein